jgi:hypothetical protein
MTGDILVRTDSNKTKHRDSVIFLSVNLGAGHVKPVARPSQNTFNYAALLFEGVRRERQMNFEAIDKHGLWNGFQASEFEQTRNIFEYHTTFSVSCFMCFNAMHLLVGAAEGANVNFYSFYKGIRESLLTGAGMATNRTQFAHAS